MWHQRASYEQANVLDVTIQCQLNVASKNIAEFYSSPHAYPTSNYQSGEPTMTSQCMQRTPDYNAMNGAYGYHDVTSQKERFGGDYSEYSPPCYGSYQNTPTYGYNSAFETVNTNKVVNCEPVPAPEVVVNPVTRSDSGYTTTCMDDSGYASPVTSLKQHRTSSAFSPPIELVKQTRNNNNASDTPQRPTSFTFPDVLTTSIEEPSEEMKIAMRERDVTQRLFALRSQNSDVANDIEHYYQSQTTIIDIERHNIICQMAYDKRSSDSINKYYNRKLLTVLEGVEQKLSVIEFSGKCKKSSVRAQHVNSKKSRLLPKHAVKVLESWYQENLENPYPSREVTLSMASEGGITVEQIRKWFANKRNRSRNNKLKVCLIGDAEDAARS